MLRTYRYRLQKGQVLALGAIALVAMAVAVFGILNVNRSVHEKIRLQNEADSHAFSLAVQEARVFNYFAYSNRALAGAYVAMATMHAYMSEAAMMVDADLAAAGAFGEISGEEYGQCLCCEGLPCCFEHCVHGFEADMNAIMYLIAWIDGSMGNKVNSIDSKFNSAMKGMGRHAKAIRTTQQATKLVLQGLMLGMVPGVDLKKLRDANLGSSNTHADDDTGASVAGLALGAKNLQSLNQVFSSSEDEKKKVFTNVVNSSRPAFTWDRGGLLAAGVPAIVLLPLLNGQLKDDCEIGTPNFMIITEMMNVGFIAGGRTAMTDNLLGSINIFGSDGFGFNGSGGDAAKDSVGKKIASFDWANGMVSWEDGVGMMSYPLLSVIAPGELKTGASGLHQASGGILSFANSPHDSSHDKEAPSGANDSDDFDTKTYFEFAATDDDEFHQPVVYASAHADTRYNDFGKRGPWELGRQGEVGLNFNGATGQVQMANDKTAHAFAKARVYYHRIGDWQEPPNFWNPYWRAKLEAPTLNELMLPMAAVDSDTLQVILGIGVGPDRAAVNVRENKNH